MATILVIEDDIWDVVGIMDEADLVDPTVDPPPPELTVTSQQVEAIILLLQHPEDNGGYGGIATTVGVPRVVVQLVDEAKLRRLAEISAGTTAQPEKLKL